jgi:hypothetical protein
MAPTHRWKNRPPGSNWGDFGEDDQDSKDMNFDIKILK